MAAAIDSKSIIREDVRVQVPPPAPEKKKIGVPNNRNAFSFKKFVSIYIKCKNSEDPLYINFYF